MYVLVWIEMNAKVEGVYKLKQQTPTDTMGVGVEVGVNLEKN